MYHFIGQRIDITDIFCSEKVTFKIYLNKENGNYNKKVFLITFGSLGKVSSFEPPLYLSRDFIGVHLHLGLIGCQTCQLKGYKFYSDLALQHISQSCVKIEQQIVNKQVLHKHCQSSYGTWVLQTWLVSKDHKRQRSSSVDNLAWNVRTRIWFQGRSNLILLWNWHYFRF